MCRMGPIAALIRLLLLCGCLTLSLLMPSAIAGLGVWALIWLLWERVPYEQRLSAPSMLELLPFAIAVQVAFDCLVPYAGDVFVLVGNAGIVAALRRPRIPRAIARASSPAARAASTCATARRAS